MVCSVCKVMEKILFKYMFNFIKDHELLSNYQSSFQPGNATVNQLVEIYDKIISSLDRGKDIRFIFCDISNAFDRVWHLGLVQKLQGLDFMVNILGSETTKSKFRRFFIFKQNIRCWGTSGVSTGTVLVLIIHQ